MKKLNVFLLFIFLLVSCTPEVTAVPVQTLATNTSTPKPTLTLRPTFTPPATLIPCPSLPVTFGEVTVVFHEPMQDGDCEDIIKYSRLTEEKFKAMGYPTGRVQVNVFATPEAVTNHLYDWAKKMGCNPDTKENIFNLWTSRGMQAMVTREGVYLLTNLPDDAWRKANEEERAHAIFGEITQAVEINILGSCQKRWQIPDWYGHGIVEYFAALFTRDLGLSNLYDIHWDPAVLFIGNEPPLYIPQELKDCTNKLAELYAGERCVYIQAEMAFVLLREKYSQGKDIGLDVLIEMTKGKSFNQAFYDVYKISVSAFSDEFDAYRLNGYGYTLIETTPNSTPEPEINTSICGIQTDSRVECIGIKIDDGGKEVYVFRIQPFNLPSPDQWIIVSNCEVINAGYWTVSSDTYDIVFNTSVFSKGKECKVEFRFSADQQVVVHLVVP
jgi:hypothetical protein